MLIVGAGGFAKELLQILEEVVKQPLFFYDDINNWKGRRFLDKYKVLQTEREVLRRFETDNRFSIGVGGPKNRQNIYNKFLAMEGSYTSIVSQQAYIGKSNVTIGYGANILAGVKVSNGVTIGIGVLIYYNAIITHDTLIGNFVEISPAAVLLGRVVVGDHTWIGTGAIIFPDVIIGKNVIIGAGAVVKTHIPDNSVAVGIPAKVIKNHLCTHK